MESICLNGEILLTAHKPMEKVRASCKKLGMVGNLKHMTIFLGLVMMVYDPITKPYIQTKTVVFIAVQLILGHYLYLYITYTFSQALLHLATLKRYP